jgi:hypothetical protein
MYSHTCSKNLKLTLLLYKTVTFKDLKKRVSLEITTQQQYRLFERLHNKPFWIWDVQEHKHEDIRTKGDCCFNHIIGLPQKDAVDKPMYGYEKMIIDCLVSALSSSSYQYQYDTQDGNDNDNNNASRSHNSNSNPNPNFNFNPSLNSSFNTKHIWIKKATGLGISEFMLRFMAWLCLKDNALSGSQMCIVTGPRIDLAIALIYRMKKLFASSSSKGIITFNTKETVIELNNVKIEAFHRITWMQCVVYLMYLLYC